MTDSFLACNQTADTEELRRLRPRLQQRALLKQAARDFKTILGSADVTQIAEADVAFHDIIYNATDNQRLIQLLNNLREQMYRYRVEYLKKKEFYPQLLQEHQEIIQASANRKKEQASACICQHIDNQTEAVIGIIHTPNKYL